MNGTLYDNRDLTDVQDPEMERLSCTISEWERQSQVSLQERGRKIFDTKDRR